MIRANIIDGNLVFIPFDETKPFIEMTEQQYNDVVDGKLKYINGVLTDTTPIIKKQKRIAEIKQRLEELNKDFIQSMLGAVIPDIEEKRAEFISLHNELRELEGKEPREYEV